MIKQMGRLQLSRVADFMQFYANYSITHLRLLFIQQCTPDGHYKKRSQELSCEYLYAVILQNVGLQWFLESHRGPYLAHAFSCFTLMTLLLACSPKSKAKQSEIGRRL